MNLASSASAFFLHLFQNTAFRDEQQVFTGQTPFPLPNQQCRNTQVNNTDHSVVKRVLQTEAIISSFCTKTPPLC